MKQLWLSLTPRLKLAIAAAVGLFLIGFAFGGAGERVTQRQAVRGLDQLAPGSGSDRLRSAVDDLALAYGQTTTRLAAQQPPAPEPVEEQPEPLTSENIVSVLQRDLSAVETRDGQETLVLVVPDGNAGQRRLVAIGDVLDDDWVIAAITKAEITLAKEGDERVLRFMAGAETTN